MSIRSPFVATKFSTLRYNSNKNLESFLKFLVFFLVCLFKFDKKFDHSSNSLPAKAHFGQKF